VKAFKKTLGGLHATPVDLDDTTGPVSCEVPGCTGMAFERMSMAGYPAGFLCSNCARAWFRIWLDATAEEDVPEQRLAVAA
jgi:hypothetical protein